MYLDKINVSNFYLLFFDHFRMKIDDFLNQSADLSFSAALFFKAGEI
jgi:hypothetical protein